MLGTTPGSGQPRHQPRPHQRGLAGTARAVDQQKRTALLGGVLQPLDRFGDVAAAAEEDRRVLGAKGGKAAERRALDLHRPHRRAAMQHILIEPFAQQCFRLHLEIVGRSKGLEGGLELPSLRAKPTLEEFLEARPLSLRSRPRPGSSSCTLGGCG